MPASQGAGDPSGGGPRRGGGWPVDPPSWSRRSPERSRPDITQ